MRLYIHIWSSLYILHICASEFFYILLAVTAVVYWNYFSKTYQYNTEYFQNTILISFFGKCNYIGTSQLSKELNTLIISNWVEKVVHITVL